MIGTTKAGRAFVRCDRCNTTLRADMPWDTSAQSVPLIQRIANARGWSFDAKKDRAECPACVAGVCEKCGAANLPTNRSPHIFTIHHRTMVHCTEQAVQGFAPVPPGLHKANPDAMRDPVLAHYKFADSWWNLRFVRVENLDELAEVEHDAAAQLVARVARIAARSTWWTAWRDEIGPALRQIDDGRRVVWRNGFPWPSLGDVVSAAQGGAR